MSAIEQQDVKIELECCTAGSSQLARLYYSGQTASGGLEHYHRGDAHRYGSRKLTQSLFLS